MWKKTGSRLFRRSLLLVTAMLLAVSGGPFLSAQSPAPKSQKAAKAAKKKAVRLTAAHVRYNQKTKTMVATGNVRLVLDDMELTAQELLYNDETETARVTGDPRFKQKGREGTADVIRADFKNKQVVLEGRVWLRQEKEAIKKETELKEHVGKVVVLRCDRLTYDYGVKQGKAEGNIVVEQEDAVAYGSTAAVDGERELVVITGGVRLEKKDGQWLEADRAMISTKEDWVELEGNIKALIQVEEEKIPETNL